jgi:glycosyltransferase involved in cell wall biosynthesis
MRLAVLHNHPIHYKHLLFQALAEAGVEFDVVFLASRSQSRHEPIPLSQELYRYRIGFDGPYESAPSLSRLAFAWRSLSELRPDIVIISGYHAIECWAAWLWARTHRRPMVMWYESNEFDYPRRWHKELLKKLFVRALSKAHVYGATNREYLIKLGMNPEDVTLKRAVVNVETFSRVPSGRSYSDDGNRRLIYVGRLAPEKNLSFVLRALATANARLPGARLFLTIAGTGPLETQLRRECTELGLDHCVRFVGYCPQKELPTLYGQSDVLILPSTREPWGLVSLEAMLCGLPVLLSRQCGCAWDLVTPDSGWAFSPWDEPGLVNLLTSLPEIPPARLAAMGEHARSIAKEYSAPACARRIVDSLSEIESEPVRTLPAALGANQ